MAKKIGIYRHPRDRTKWVCRWTVVADSRQKKKSKTCDSKKEAENFAAAKHLELEKRGNSEPAKSTLEQFLDKWILQEPKVQDYRPDTIKLYDNTIKRLKSYFKRGTALRSITAQNAGAFVAYQERLDGQEKKLSSWAKHRIIRHCKTIFATAVIWKLIEENPFGGIKRPECTNVEAYYVTTSEYHKLLDVAPTLRWKAFYSLAYTAAMRLGEILSLTWDNVDLQRHIIKIRNEIGTTNNPPLGKTANTPPFKVKGKGSIRTIPIPDETVELLDELKVENLSEQTEYVVYDRRQEYMMREKWKAYRKAGRPWCNRDFKNNVLKRFKHHIELADINPKGKKLTIHILRKNGITNWVMDNRNPKVVQIWAGHTDLKTTLEFYSLVTEEQETKGMLMLDARLAKS